MQGSQVVIEKLNSLLAGELSAMDLYLLQGRMFGDWGYTKLQERLVHESGDERQHADLLIQRILFLNGKPDVTARVPVNVGDSPKQMLQNDLQYELDVAKALNDAMAVCVAEGDNASRELLERLLKDTEQDHILWLETQLRLMDSVGVELYLSEHI
jgi:bacterioferritin